MDQASTESTTCTGLPSDTYDRYVLGLLDSQERAIVEQQIEQGCPACTSGVQRSMNLWLVFANTLEHVEPAADFRARLVRIAELSNRVLTVPKRYRGVREPAILISSLIVICLILAALLIFTWLAGQQSSQLDAQRATNELGRMQHESAQNYVELHAQLEKNRLLESKQRSSGAALDIQQKLEDQLTKAQAEVQQYRNILQRDSQRTIDNSALVTALSSPGVKLMRFKNAEGAAATACAFVIENSKVIFVASNLAAPSEEHRYQLWLVRKEEPKFVSAGVFSTSEDKSVVVTYDEDKEVISGVAGILVTEEPVNGNASPSGTKIMETVATPAETSRIIGRISAADLPTEFSRWFPDRGI